MKIIVRSVLAFILVFGLSKPSRACNPPDWKLVSHITAMAWTMGVVTTNVLATLFSDSARQEVEQKMPASDDKDRTKSELMASTVFYGIASVAGGIAFFMPTYPPYEVILKSSAGRIVLGTVAGLAVAASAVGIGVNSAAYQTAQAFFSNTAMLGTSIAGFVGNTISAAVLVYVLQRAANMQVTPQDSQV